MALKQTRFVVFKAKGDLRIANEEKSPLRSELQQAGQFYWHLEAKNGKLIACSGEGFKTKRACIKSITNVRASVIANAPIFEEA